MPTASTISPMENFNRSNPFVIQAKVKYDELQQLYHEMMKLLLVIIFEAIAAITVAGIAHSLSPNSTMLRTALSIVIFVMCPVVLYRATLQYTIGDPKNDSINKVVTMQMSEIMNINLEVVYDTILDMKYLQGKAQYVIDILKVFRYIIAIALVLMCICIVV